MAEGKVYGPMLGAVVSDHHLAVKIPIREYGRRWVNIRFGNMILTRGAIFALVLPSEHGLHDIDHRKHSIAMGSNEADIQRGDDAQH